MGAFHSEYIAILVKGRLPAVGSICVLKSPIHSQFNPQGIIDMHDLQGIAVIILYLPFIIQGREYSQGKNTGRHGPKIYRKIGLDKTGCQNA